MKFNIESFSDKDMFIYNDIYVTGNRIVFENKIPLKVRDSEKSIKMNIISHLHCLITENNLIYTKGNILFCDYFECNKPKVNLFNN